jgi:hypothetical protein
LASHQGGSATRDLELTSASLPLRRLVRDWEHPFRGELDDAGLRLMRVSRIAWAEHQSLLAVPLKPDPLSDVEHAYRTLEDVAAHIARTPPFTNAAIDLGNRPGGVPSKAQRAIADVDAAQEHLMRVDAAYDTLLEVEQLRWQSRWWRRLRTWTRARWRKLRDRAREWRRR